MKEDMNLFIHPHNNPKITWPMAAYREPKPEKNYPKHPDYYQSEKIDYQWRYREWQSSRVAYIKEPTFEDGDTYYTKSGNRYKWDGGNNEMARQNNFSHYHERQEIDLGDFRHVREEKYTDPVSAIKNNVTIGMPSFEWQEVKEPNANDIEYYYNNHWNLKKFEKDLERFQKGKREGTILLEEKI